MFKKSGDAKVVGDPIEVDKKDEDKTRKIKKDKKEEEREEK